MTEPQVGLKLSQPGVPVSQAADYQLIFNSAWPSLQIGFDTTVTLNPSSSQTVVHGLGFIPFSLGTVILNNISVGRIFGSAENFGIGPQGAVTMSFDKNNIYLANSNVTNTYSVNLKCFNIDLTVDTDYTLPQSPILPSRFDPTFGMKIAKSNKSINSSDLRDFIINTQCQSPAVLSIVTPQRPLLPGGTKGTIAYLNPASFATFQNKRVPYVPWTYGFYSSDGIKYTPIPAGLEQAPPGFLLTNNINNPEGISISGPGAVLTYSDGTGTATATIVVLRDPLVVPNSVQVTY